MGDITPAAYLPRPADSSAGQVDMNYSLAISPSGTPYTANSQAVDGQSRRDRHGRSASPRAHSGHGMDGSTADVAYYLAFCLTERERLRCRAVFWAEEVLPGFQPLIGSRYYFCFRGSNSVVQSRSQSLLRLT
jgi:hypothetical protein